MLRYCALASLFFASACGDVVAPLDAETDGALLEGSVPDASIMPDAALPPMDADVEAGSPDAGTPDAALPMGLVMGSHQLFFVGNSYTGGLIAPYRSLAEADPVERDPFRVDGVSPGGQRFAGHLESARSEGTPLNVALVSGSAEERDWDVVVLQEQSQIPGFPAGNREVEASAAAVVELAALIEATGATTLLYMTWGRRDGDERNRSLYPDFLTMQERLEAGYRIYADRILARGGSVVIAPVGPAFRLVYRDVEAAGMDPTTPGSEFHALYSGDGSHPSIEGSYLTAAVILGVVIGGPVVDIDWMPGRIDAERARALRLIADRANAAERARGDG